MRETFDTPGTLLDFRSARLLGSLLSLQTHNETTESAVTEEAGSRNLLLALLPELGYRTI
jgi:hypothetical protein